MISTLGTLVVTSNRGSPKIRWKDWNTCYVDGRKKSGGHLNNSWHSRCACEVLYKQNMLLKDTSFLMHIKIRNLLVLFEGKMTHGGGQKSFTRKLYKVIKTWIFFAVKSIHLQITKQARKQKYFCLEHSTRKKF